jgi:hypothetical protein
MSNSRNIATQSDLEELKKSYRFVLDSEDDGSKATKSKNTWQERMVLKYHQQLYKTYVLADFSHYEQSRIGLRWR